MSYSVKGNFRQLSQILGCSHDNLRDWHRHRYFTCVKSSKGCKAVVIDGEVFERIRQAVALRTDGYPIKRAFQKVGLI